MLKTEIAEIMNKDGQMFDIAQKITYNRNLSAEEKEVSEVCDAWVKEIASTGCDKDNEIASFIRRTVNDEIYNAPDELLDRMFDRGNVGEFDDYDVTKDPKNTLEAHDAVIGGNVDKSYIDFEILKPTWKHAQVEFELPYVEETTNGVNYELKSTIRQASKLLKEKPSLVKLRHTNPITRANTTTASGLQMPAAEDVIKPKKKTISVPTETKQEASAELLSILNITPNKGFYLTTVEDTLALFGFVNDEVFLFNKFKDLGQINLQARYYDKNGGNDIYIVRLDNYKAMIEISDTSMRELAKI